MKIKDTDLIALVEDELTKLCSSESLYVCHHPKYGFSLKLRSYITFDPPEWHKLASITEKQGKMICKKFKEVRPRF